MMIFDKHERTDAEMLPHPPTLHFLAHCLLDVLHVPCEERDGVNTSICFVIDRRCAKLVRLQRLSEVASFHLYHVGRAALAARMSQQQVPSSSACF